MKTIKELKTQTPIFLHIWNKTEDVINDFENINLTFETILFASYGYDNYNGDAFVLFELAGKLYEVNGNHCSCMGLENQWVPEETTIKALAHRLTVGTMGVDEESGNEFATELKQFLGI